MIPDIRWQQRFKNFKKAFDLLSEAVNMNDYSDLEREGMIQRFEFTYELAWNTMKDFLEDQGTTNITGSKDAIKEAFNSGLITDGDEWFKMVESRKLSSHTYDEKTAEEIADKIKENYSDLFAELIKRLEIELNKGQGQIFDK